MGERKVLNFYISPDFDHSIIPRVKRDWNKAVEVRMMLPFSLRCNTCGEYMYAGKKFNSKKETIKGETYLGIRILRFTIKCSVCSAEITFKTDPKNSDYECESGASRNFEIWRDTDVAMEQAKKEREDEDNLDAMKSLENRTLDSKLEMDVLDALDEIKSINQKHERVDTTSLIASFANSSSSSAVVPSTIENETEIENEIVKNVQFKRKSRVNQPLPDSDEENVETVRVGSSSNDPASITEALIKSIRKQAQSSNSAFSKSDLVQASIIRKKRKKQCNDTDKSTGEFKEQSVAAFTTLLPEPVTIPVASTSTSATSADSAMPSISNMFAYSSETDSD